MKAISVRQPWAWLLIHGGKDIENRDWPTGFRGRIAIHAAKGMTVQEWQDAADFVADFDEHLANRIPGPHVLVRGAIIGTMELQNCVARSYSPWFQGKYGFMLSDPQPCDPIPIKGALGLWEWDSQTAPAVPATATPEAAKERA